MAYLTVLNAVLFHVSYAVVFVTCMLQSVINKELLENLKVFEDGFELDQDEMNAIFKLNKNLRKLVPINKLKSGEVVIRDGKSRHFPYNYVEP